MESLRQVFLSNEVGSEWPEVEREISSLAINDYEPDHDSSTERR